MQPCRRADRLMAPQIARPCGRNLQPNILPLQVYSFLRLSQVENRNIAFSERCAIRNPRADVPSLERLVPATAVLIYFDHFLIRDERGRGRVVAGQVSAEN